jgi:hypothetical protein
LEKENKSNKLYPYYHVIANGRIISIFEDPLSPEPDSADETPTKPEKKKIVRKKKNTTNESSSSAFQSGSGIPQGLEHVHAAG